MKRKVKNQIQDFCLSKGEPVRSRAAKKAGHALVALVLSTATFQSAIANVNLATAPIFLKESVDPNLLFIFDDSGSMGREYMPDDVWSDLQLFEDDDGPLRYRRDGENQRIDTRRRWYHSNRVNKVYYDPAITYLPPFKPDGSGRHPNSDFSNAWRNGYDTGRGTVDLNNRYRTSRFDYRNGAFYYRFDSTTDCEADPEDNDCYTLVFLSNESAEQQQNFANWYSYYSLRVYASRAGISEAFFDLPENIRVGYGAINEDDNNIDGVTTDTLISGVRPFNAARREQFLSWLQSKSVSGGTPLRPALEDAGEYYSRTDNRGPWGNNPGTSDNSSHVECRPSYTIMMTDGIWNGNDPEIGNVDNTPGPSHANPKPEGEDFSYQAVSPFADDHSDTLADMAMKYWKTDLRPNLDDKVPTAGIDEAFWQHMTTFTIGLGVEGEISESDAFAAIQNGNTINWPEPSANSGSPNIDDLLHAAVNGRGGFASAQNPDEFSREIGGFLDTVIARSETSASAAAVSTSVLQTSSTGFFAGFRSEDWSGTLIGYGLKSDEEIWDAEETIRNLGASNRNIFSHNGSRSVELKDIQDLSSLQQEALNADPENPGESDNLGSNRIAWIRGEEGAHDSFRVREFTNESGETVRRLLGDIVNANPLYVSNSNFGFSRLPGEEGKSYAPYRSTSDYQNRTKALYVSANDGMLHAFDSETGEELFAYMPGELLEPAVGSSHAKISSLMSSTYTHRYFMDGSPTALDARIEVDGSTKWRTILVGSMGAGGRSIFAIDVSNPDTVGKDDILWEFNHPDLGFGVSDPKIARLPNGDWAVVFGNGYNGDDETASLFVVRLSDGTLLKQLDTNIGSSSRSNGLAAPVLSAFPSRGAITQFVYAGDLLGNLWRFDLSDENTSNWSLSKIFTAEGPDGSAQPITVAPTLTINPSDLDTLILTVGTGSFIQNGDDTTDQIQSLYAIIEDLNQNGLTRNDLLEQAITEQEEVSVARADGSGNNAFVIRKTTSNKLTSEQGWYLDLSYNGEKTGERVISPASYPAGIFPDRVRFSTLIPDPDPCGSGRSGFIMDLNLISGGAPDDPVFDLNSDSDFTNDDKISDVAPSGIERGDGSTVRTIVIGDPDSPGGPEDGAEAFITEPGKADCEDGPCGKTLDEFIGRQTWEQLR